MTVRHTRYTTAPATYDGFGTRTLRIVGVDKAHRAVREVRIDDEHLGWQETRYASGGYYTQTDPGPLSRLGNWTLLVEPFVVPQPPDDS